jgi:hypothetical protein
MRRLVKLDAVALDQVLFERLLLDEALGTLGGRTVERFIPQVTENMLDQRLGPGVTVSTVSALEPNIAVGAPLMLPQMIARIIGLRAHVTLVRPFVAMSSLYVAVTVYHSHKFFLAKFALKAA